MDPVLTFCRGNKLHFYQLHTSDGTNFKSFCLQKVDLTCSPIHIAWINSRSVLVLDDKEALLLLEAGSGEEVEATSASEAHLVYASSDLKVRHFVVGIQRR